MRFSSGFDGREVVGSSLSAVKESSIVVVDTLLLVPVGRN